MSKVIESREHPIVKRFVKLKENKKFRKEQASVIIEGKKIISEIAKIVPIKTLLRTSDTFYVKAKETYLVNEAIVKKISGMEHSEGVIAEVEMPSFHLSHQIKKLLVLNAINDPGNLGTLIRTALALGFDQVYLMGDCCDPFNEKALTASRGAVFKIPLAKGEVDELKELSVKFGLEVFVADLEGVEPSEVLIDQGVGLILSSEAHGPERRLTELFKTVTIPMKGKMESLNVAVAGGILMYCLGSKS